MIECDLGIANIHNLASFWASCGVEQNLGSSAVTFSRSTLWPGRLWFEYEATPSALDAESALELLARNTKDGLLPIWNMGSDEYRDRLIRAGYEVQLEQVAMAMALDRDSIDLTSSKDDSHFDFITIDSEPGIRAWTEAASRAFGYPIDEASIARSFKDPHCVLVAALRDGKMVGTGLRFDTDMVAGFHMVGVDSSNRRQGLAKKIMHYMLGQALEDGVQFSTLQASQAGESLYLKLGYKRQFVIQTLGRAH
ncbi:MAG: GNAT superfamily N-acetyltransferase [Planctomycetota bacterium]|jgi:GNAT superfamily N-acetyltransferase